MSDLEGVLDASAVLAYLQGEAGADLVQVALERGAACGAANWSEVAQKVASHGRDWELARALLQSWELAVLPVTADDAERAAQLWERSPALSLADRLCLALADRLGVTAWTADQAWGSDEPVCQIR